MNIMVDVKIIGCAHGKPNRFIGDRLIYLRSIYALLLLLVLITDYGIAGAVDLLKQRQIEIPSRAFAIEAKDVPLYIEESHNVGTLGLSVHNWGFIGHGGRSYYEVSCEFPYGSNMQYFYCGYPWIGGIIGEDTLVTMGIAETRADEGEAGDFMRRSTIRSNPYYSPDARSEQDFICTYNDTSTFYLYYDHYENRPHTPLGVAIRQSSYAWSYAYASDFILFHFCLTNIGSAAISGLFIGYDCNAPHLASGF